MNKRSIQIYSWADLGYRKLGKVIQYPNGVVDKNMLAMIVEAGKYDVQDSDWIRLNSRRKRGKISSFSVIQTYDHASTDRYDKRAYADSLRKEDEALAGEKMYRWRSLEDVMGLIEYAKKRDTPCARLHYLSAALSIPSPAEHFVELLSVFCTEFWKDFPTGRVLTVGVPLDSNAALTALVKGVYSFSQVSKLDWTNLGAENKFEFPTLRHWHSQNVSDLLRAILKIAGYIWYPHVTGFVFGGASILLAADLDPPGTYTFPTFPRDWFDLLTTETQFAEQHISNIDELLFNKSDPERMRLAHRRPTIESAPPPQQRFEFTEWIVREAGHWILNLIDIANFTNNSFEVDSKLPFEHLLTVERIVRRTADVCIGRHSGCPKMTVFEIADLYATLARRFGRVKQDTEFFKYLFNPAEGASYICEKLRSIPGVGIELSHLAKKDYHELQEMVIASIAFRSKVKSSGVLVRNKKLEDENLEPISEFVANVVRAYRNGHHGYFTDADPANRPSRYLWMVDGDLPDSIVRLPVYWLFTYITDTSFVGWNTLRFEHYEP